MADTSQTLLAVETNERASSTPRQPFDWRKLLTYALLTFGALLSMFPFLMMVVWSLMTNAEVISGSMIPRALIWENYSEAWSTAQFSQFMWNSARISIILIFGLLILCVPAAYAFARIKFWGRNVLFAVFLATLMIPDVVTLIPNFLTVVWISRFSEALFGPAGAWLNNWPSLTIPFMVSAFTVFLLRQFFAQIPDELWDSARIDGAGHLQFLWHVVIPVSRAPIMTTVTFAFIGSWNALVWSLLVVNTDTWRPVAYGLTKFVQTDAGDKFNLQMAASVTMILPILILFFITQKQFTEGVWAGSLKG